MDWEELARREPYFALLTNSGAPASWYRAVFSYNHADWYVQDVLRQANAWLREGGLDSDGLGSNAELATLKQIQITSKR